MDSANLPGFKGHGMLVLFRNRRTTYGYLFGDLKANETGEPDRHPKLHNLGEAFGVRDKQRPAIIIPEGNRALLVCYEGYGLE